MRVATSNIPAREMTEYQLATGVKAVLAEGPRYAAFQEIGPDHNHTLRGASKTYRIARAKGGPPILYDHGATEVLHVKRLVLSRSAWVGRLVGRKSTLPASIATEARFEDDERGEGVVIDAHLDAEVQLDGKYRTDKAHRPRVRRHKRQCRRLIRRERHHLKRGRWVKVCLDGNFDGLELPPLVSCWKGQPHIGTLEGPNGGLSKRAPDVVFGETKSTHVKTIVTGSDHRAVVVDD